MKKKRTWTALILIAALILIFAAPANCEAEDARILLMRCYQQDRSGVCSEAVLLDEEGCVWQYQSDDPLPDTDEERLAFLAECQNVTLVRRLDVNRVLELESLIAAAAEPQMEDQAFGIRDYGLDTYSAVRYGSDGIVEIIRWQSQATGWWRIWSLTLCALHSLLYRGHGLRFGSRV